MCLRETTVRHIGVICMTFLMARRAQADHAFVMSEPTSGCIICEGTSDRVPLISMEYRGGTFRICPQHLPIIIHDPSQLIGLLAGAESFRPSAHQD